MGRRVGSALGLLRTRQCRARALGYHTEAHGQHGCPGNLAWLLTKALSGWGLQSLASASSAVVELFWLIGSPERRIRELPSCTFVAGLHGCGNACQPDEHLPAANA